VPRPIVQSRKFGSPNKGKCLFYLDDIVIYAKSLEEHKQKLNQLFQRLREVGFSLQSDKYEKRLDLLGSY